MVRAPLRGQWPNHAGSPRAIELPGWFLLATLRIGVGRPGGSLLPCAVAHAAVVSVLGPKPFHHLCSDGV